MNAANEAVVKLAPAELFVNKDVSALERYGAEPYPQTQSMIAEDKFVVAHSEGEFARQGKIVEHRDCIQDVGPAEKATKIGMACSCRSRSEVDLDARTHSKYGALRVDLILQGDATFAAARMR